MIRCRQCDHPNPEDHRFCGMCGSRIDAVARSLAIDDDDPLEIESPAFEKRSHSVVQFRANQQRETVQDRVSRNGGDTHASGYSSTAIDSAPHATGAEPLRRDSGQRPAGGIGGPSFLGLNYDSPNNGFIYDDPNGFIYDTDAKQPEYLLEEIPRGVSWRAWALFLLLLIGAGLGYVQWRASHHQGPDIASILARNGPTVDPSRPVMPDKSAKPAENKNASTDANGSSDSSSDADDDSQPASSAKADNKAAAAEAANPASTAASTKDVKASDANRAKTQAADEKDDADNDAKDAEEEAGSTASATKSGRAVTKPESDGPVQKSRKSAAIRPAVEEEPAQPKSLGDKDPLLIQADKYINGRGAPKNCSRGVNLLREAVSAGNPAASVKLGALYWSGNCVTQSKVTAYQWFSRAHSLEPKNRWIERSRNSLWASMSPAEQRRVNY